MRRTFFLLLGFVFAACTSSTAPAPGVTGTWQLVSIDGTTPSTVTMNTDAFGPVAEVADRLSFAPDGTFTQTIELLLLDSPGVTDTTLFISGIYAFDAERGSVQIGYNGSAAQGIWNGHDQLDVFAGTSTTFTYRRR